MVARSQRAIYRDRVGRLLDSFGKMARALDAVQGRKHILYLSEGFDSRELSGSTAEGGGAREAEWILRGQSWKVDSDIRFGNSGLQEKMKKDLELFNRSDCIIHAIDIGGLRAASDPAGSVYNTINGQEALFYFSDQTGGEFLRNSNDLSNSFDKLLERTGLIYILAFQPVRVPENGKFHPIKVRVKKGNYRVSHRTGYYEPKSQKTLSPIEKTLAQSAGDHRRSSEDRHPHVGPRGPAAGAGRSFAGAGDRRGPRRPAARQARFSQHERGPLRLRHRPPGQDARLPGAAGRDRAFQGGGARWPTEASSTTGCSTWRRAITPCAPSCATTRRDASA